MKKILFCDDNTDLRNVMTRYLSCYGLEMNEASHAQEAFNKLKKQKFDLFIFGLNPEKNENLRILNEVRLGKESLSTHAKVLAVYSEEPEIEERKIYRKLHLALQSKYSSPEKWYEKIQMLLQEKMI